MKARFLAPLVLLVLLSACRAFGTVDPDRLVRAYTDPTSRFIEVDGMDVHLRDEGTGPPLLLLHGAGASLHTWDDWTESLRADYRVLRIDLPPTGLTGPHPEDRYGPDTYDALVNGVLDALEIDEVTLIGNSLGGYIAARYAAGHTSRVRALVLLGPAGYPQELPWALGLLDTPVLGWLAAQVTPRWVVARAVREAYGDPARASRETVDRYWHLLRAPGVRSGLRQLADAMDEARRDEPEWAGKISVPTLLIWGEEDRFTPIELAELWMRDLPQARLVTLDRVGHVPMEEVPELSGWIAKSFLAEVYGPEP